MFLLGCQSPLLHCGCLGRARKPASPSAPSVLLAHVVGCRAAEGRGWHTVLESAVAGTLCSVGSPACFLLRFPGGLLLWRKCMPGMPAPAVWWASCGSMIRSKPCDESYMAPRLDVPHPCETFVESLGLPLWERQAEPRQSQPAWGHMANCTFASVLLPSPPHSFPIKQLFLSFHKSIPSSRLQTYLVSPSLCAFLLEHLPCPCCLPPLWLHVRWHPFLSASGLRL